MAGELRKSIDTPMVFMTYFNIVLKYGVLRFVRDAKAVGVDGLIVPDLPMEESEELSRITSKEDFSLIMLTAPTTPPERFREIASVSTGFIYYVSLTGVTGARRTLPTHIRRHIEQVRAITSKPICVGFGLSNPQQIHRISRFCDGVIVGSAVINRLEQYLSDRNRIPAKVGLFVKDLIKGLK